MRERLRDFMAARWQLLAGYVSILLSIMSYVFCHFNGRKVMTFGYLFYYISGSYLLHLVSITSGG